MTTLTVIYLRDTGHALAAVTRVTAPGAAEPVAALVGPGLPLRRVGDKQHPRRSRSRPTGWPPPTSTASPSPTTRPSAGSSSTSRTTRSPTSW